MSDVSLFCNCIKKSGSGFYIKSIFILVFTGKNLFRNLYSGKNSHWHCYGLSNANGLL
ncbi:hypothetical protein [Clostridium thailandense]|uniref:hypothetical protein n=1 Tax=Clostridium thailandense TaxID=2794346 RepID=UPI00398A4003